MLFFLLIWLQCFQSLTRSELFFRAVGFSQIGFIHFFQKIVNNIRIFFYWENFTVYFHILSNLMGKLSPRSYPIQLERIWKSSFLSVTVSCGAQFVNPLYVCRPRQRRPPCCGMRGCWSPSPPPRPPLTGEVGRE